MDIAGVPPLRTGSLVWQPRAGAPTLTVVAKLTYALVPGEAELAEDQEEINEHDHHWNDDETRSLYVASDLCPRKARPDVTLVGNAFAPGGEPLRSLVARMVIGSIDKQIEIFGERTIGRDGVLREPSRFARMPLRYERAAGGPGTSNPVGVRVGRSAQADHTGNVTLPNLQPAGTSGRVDAIEPVGFGPMPAWFPARRERAGRYATSLGGRVTEEPLPDDLDYACFNVAPADQQPQVIQENERIVLQHLHREHARLSTALPGSRARAFVEPASGAPRELAMRCDSLWIDTDRAICTLTWRGEIALSSRDERGRVLVGLEARQSRLTYDAVADMIGARSVRSASRMAPTTSAPPKPGVVVPPGPGVPPPATAQQLSNMALSSSGPLTSSMIAPPAVVAPPAAIAPAPLPPPPPKPALTPAPPATAPAGGVVELSADDIEAEGPSSNTFAQVAGAPPPAFVRAARLSPDALPFVRDAAPPPFTPPPAAAEDRPRRATTMVDPPSTAAAKGPAWLQSTQTNAPNPRGSLPSIPAIEAPPPPAPAARAAPRFGIAEAIDLVFFDRDSAGRVRAAFGDITMTQPPALPGDNDDERIASELGQLLATAPRAGSAGLDEALATAASLDGRFRPPIVALAGDLRFVFDETEALRLTVSAALPFAAGDARLREVIDAAKEVLGTTFLSPASSVVEGLTQRIRDAFSQSGRPASYLTSGVERALLERRAYQKRVLLGGDQIRALFVFPGATDPRTTYLPWTISRILPMFPVMEARLIAEVLPAQDHAEVYPVSLRALALGRLVVPARR